MKNLIRISLIVILIFGLLHAVAGGSIASAREIGSRAETGSIFTVRPSGEDVNTPACLVSVRGEKCAQQKVGWNS
jgi:hypothetical protein